MLDLACRALLWTFYVVSNRASDVEYYGFGGAAWLS